MATLSEICAEMGITWKYVPSCKMDNEYVLRLMDECEELTDDEALMIWIEVIVGNRADIRRQIENMIGTALPRLKMGEKWPDDVMSKVADAYSTNDNFGRLIYRLAKAKVTTGIWHKAVQWGDILRCRHLLF